MFYSEEQIQLRDTLKNFFADQINPAYLKSRCENQLSSDKDLVQKIEQLGLKDFFADKDNNASLVELGIIAYESAYQLLPEFLYDRLFAETYLISVLNLPDLKNKRVVYAGFENTDPELSNSDKIGSHEFIATQECDFIIFKAIKDNSEKLYYVSAQKAQVVNLDYLDRSLRYVNLIVKDSPVVMIEGADPVRIQSDYLTLLASGLAGAARKVFDLTLGYTKTRKQFDKEICSFQTIQHYLSEMYLKVESMKSLSEFACFTSVRSPEQLYLSAQSAIRYATCAASEVAEKAVQVHGGIGFTWEYELHYYLRRIKTLQSLCYFLDSENQRQRFIMSL